MKPFIKEIPGTRYGFWRVLKFHKIDTHNDARWWCRCEKCGKTYSVRGFAMRNGTTTKCKACAIKEWQRARVI